MITIEEFKLENQQTFIPGKDRALEDTLARIHNALAEAGLEVEIKNEKNPVPGVWSVHLTEKTTGLYTNGKGATRLASIASAYGEFCERLGTGYFFAPLCTGIFQPKGIDGKKFDWVFDPAATWHSNPETMLSPSLWNLFDADQFFRSAYSSNPAILGVLNDAQTGGFKRTPVGSGICCLPFFPLPSANIQTKDQPIWFPLNLIWNLYASNGLSAGNSPLEARIQSLSEIMERHVKYRIISESLCLPDIPPSHIPEGVRTSIHAMETMGYRIMAKDASLGGKFPVIAVALIEPSSGEMLLSFGAHPRFDVALERTVTELLQGRALEYSDEFTAPSRDEEMTAEPGNLESHFINSTGLVPSRFFTALYDFPFTEWAKPATREAEYHILQAILEREGLTAYIRERPFLGLQVCQILVPGMSEIYPFEELWEQNTSRFQPFRTLLASPETLTKSEILALNELAEEEFSSPNNGQSLPELLGIDAGAAGFWEGATVGELLVLLRLRAGFLEEAQEFLDYIFDWEAIKPGKRAFWRAISDLLANSNKSSTEALFPQVLYDSRQVEAARQALSEWPASVFPGFGRDFQHGPAHRRLLALYESYCRLLAVSE